MRSSCKKNKYYRMKIYLYLLGWLLLFPSAVQAQSWWFKIAGTDKYRIFHGDTNDDIFIKGERYMISESPLSVFRDYGMIYYISNEIKYSMDYDIPISTDKYYNIYWAIGPDSIIYLCQIDIWDIDDFRQKARMNFHTYVDLPAILRLPGTALLSYHLDPAKYMHHIPVEQLTGLKFRKSPYFPMILDIMPLNENGVIPALWYSDTLYVKPIKNAYDDKCGPYHQLIVQNGRVTEVNRIVPVIPDWYLQPLRRKQE